MTEDKDLKRLVRARMAKTGESYTAARAHFRPPPSGGGDVSIDGFARAMYTRTGVERLGEHLERRYGTPVTKLTPLDVGVLRVDRQGGPSWVARVFPAVRAVEQAELDAGILRHLAARGVPAERCADRDPVSVLDGQAVLVTEHIAGPNGRSDTSGPTLFALGELLGRLHALPVEPPATARQAGSWHHVSPDGGSVGADADALLRLMEVAERDVGPDEREPFERARHALRTVDSGDDLPQALTHPDPCGANAIIAPDGPVLIDWTGAGRGARLQSLAYLLAGSLQPHPGLAPTRDPRRIDAIIAGYRRHVRLEAEEIERLPAVMGGPHTVMSCWAFLFQQVPARQAARSIADHNAAAGGIARRVAEAFDADIEELTGWYTEAKPAVHPGQGTLL